MQAQINKLEEKDENMKLEDEKGHTSKLIQLADQIVDAQVETVDILDKQGTQLKKGISSINKIEERTEQASYIARGMGSWYGTAVNYFLGPPTKDSSDDDDDNNNNNNNDDDDDNKKEDVKEWVLLQDSPEDSETIVNIEKHRGTIDRIEQGTKLKGMYKVESDLEELRDKVSIIKKIAQQTREETKKQVELAKQLGEGVSLANEKVDHLNDTMKHL